MNKIIKIALDGPSGSGKSTIAKALSEKLKILYLDTGAMYRAVALKAIKCGVDPFDEEGVKTFIDDIDLKIKYENGSQRTFLDGEDVSGKIREPHVSMAASNISSLKCVRLKMVEMQRKIASEISCVLDGRDIGSYVLPNFHRRLHEQEDFCELDILPLHFYNLQQSFESQQTCFASIPPGFHVYEP